MLYTEIHVLFQNNLRSEMSKVYSSNDYTHETEGFKHVHN